MDHTPKNRSEGYSRKKFLKLIGNLNMVLLASFAARKNLYAAIPFHPFADEPSLDNKMQKYVALARAMVHTPDPAYAKSLNDPDEYSTRRNAAIALLTSKAYLASDFSFPPGVFSDLVLNDDPEKLYKGLSIEIPQTDLIKGASSLELSVLGTGLAGFAGLVAAFSIELVAPMALIGAAGTAFSLAAALKEDPHARQTIDESALAMSQLLWSDPRAKKIMTKEVKAILKEGFGIDYGASIEENKSYLPQGVRQYVDFYLNSKGLSPEQIKKNEEATIKVLSNQINQTIGNAVGQIIKDLKASQVAEQNKQVARAYREGEIKGAVYLVSVLADHFLSPKGAQVVNVLANSAVQMDMMITAMSLGTLGPVRMAAGCVLIILNLCGLFGNSGPSTDQLILNAINQVQNSIYNLNKEMRDLFGIVIENQQRMMARIDQQFDLLKNKQDQALKELLEIKTELDLVLDEARTRGRHQETQALDDKINLLNVQINKKVTKSGIVNFEDVERAIVACWSYATQVSKYGDFTLLPHPDEARMDWDAQKVGTTLRDDGLVDHFVGLVPLIMARFTPNQLVNPINNPKALARAVFGLSSAYFIFPTKTKPYETGLNHYLKDLKMCLDNSKSSLRIAVSPDTIAHMKAGLMTIAENILVKCFDAAIQSTYIAHGITEGKSIPLLINGPINELLLESSAAEKEVLNSYFPNNSIEYKDIIDRDGVRRHIMNLKINPYIPEFIQLTIRGTNYNDPHAGVNPMEFFNYLEKLAIIKIDKGTPFTKPIHFYSNDGILDGPYAGVYTVNFTAEESCVANKVTVNRTSGDLTIIGDGIQSGWIQSQVSKQKTTSGNPLQGSIDYIVNDEKHVEYVNREILDQPFVGDSSTSFLSNLKDEVNTYFKIRNEVINKMIGVIKDPNNLLCLELETSILCLKYLAGLNVYIKTGNVELGTAVFKDKVAGINFFLKSQEDGSVKQSLDKGMLFSGRDDFSQLVTKVTDLEYLKSKKYLEKIGDKKIPLKDYVKTEVLLSFDQLITSYTDSYFSKNKLNINLPEITLSEVMLASAQKSLHHFK